MSAQYRETMVVMDLGWVDLTLEYSTQDLLIYTISGERPSVCDSVKTDISSLMRYLRARV